MTRRGFLSTALQTARRPNVVLILTDNHGAWTLGCYGNRDIRTPNIDALAREGVLFTRAFANNAVCSPTRASLMTGLMPSQHGVHRYLGAGGAQIGPRAYYTLAEFPTLPRRMKEAGYATGLCGKWHLGANMTPQDGFGYWVTMPHGHTPGFYGQQVIEDGSIRTEDGYLTDFWTRHAVKFLEANAARPFYLQLTYNGPYGLGGALTDGKTNRHSAYYASRDLPSMPRGAAHPWNQQYGAWMDNVDVRRRYAAEVSAVDDGVGEVVATLNRLGVRDNTLIVFAADQGLAGGHSGFWGMGDHTRPLTAFDWNMSIPLIVSHRGQTREARVDELVSTYDVFPSLMDHLGMASVPQTPGRSFAPALRGDQLRNWDNSVFYEFENVRAIRTAEWKYIERIHEEPNELYQVAKDPGERLNLAGRGATRDTEANLRRRLHAFFDRHADPKWDLWRGGRSKSGLITGKLFGLDIAEGR